LNSKAIISFTFRNISIVLICLFFLSNKAYSQKIEQEIDSILYLDQVHREKIASLVVAFGEKSKEVDSLFYIIEKQDSINLVKVKTILSEYSWCTVKELGNERVTALFLVIQHSDIKTMNEFLPLLEIEHKKGCLDAHNYSLIVDRTRLYNSKKQLFGTQLGRYEDNGQFYVLPLKHPRRVNHRRKKMGLPTIDLYTSAFEFEWKIKTYKSNYKKHKKLSIKK
jgi:hypothetical protein